MTVSSTTSPNIQYAGSGSTGPFSTGFVFVDEADLRVVQTDASGVETVLTLTTDYTVSGGGSPAATGSITTVVAVPSGETINIIRQTTKTQVTDYIANGTFPAETHEAALDKVTLITQELEETAGRSINLSETSALSGIAFPDPGALGFVRWNAAGTALETVVLSSTSAGIVDIVEDLTPQLGANLDTNSFNITFDTGDGILDDSGNEQLTFTKTASAVNHFDILNSATGSAPVFSAAGTDANIDFHIHGKGTGNVILSDGTDITKKLSFEVSGATTAKTLTFSSSHTDNRTVTFPDATDTLVGKATTDTLTNKTLTSPVLNTAISGTAFLDEDDLVSDSATKVASQQSIKAYVDANIGVAATQAEQETGTATGVYVSPGRQHYHQSAAKCWVSFDGTGTIAIEESYNVAGLVDNGVGDYTVTIDTDFSTADYCPIIGSSGSTTEITGNIVTRAVGTFRLQTKLNATLVDTAQVATAIFGDQ